MLAGGTHQSSSASTTKGMMITTRSCWLCLSTSNRAKSSWAESSRTLVSMIRCHLLRIICQRAAERQPGLAARNYAAKEGTHGIGKVPGPGELGGHGAALRGLEFLQPPVLLHIQQALQVGRARLLLRCRAGVVGAQRVFRLWSRPQSASSPGLFVRLGPATHLVAEQEKVVAQIVQCVESHGEPGVDLVGVRVKRAHGPHALGRRPPGAVVHAHAQFRLAPSRHGHQVERVDLHHASGAQRGVRVQNAPELVCGATRTCGE